MPLRVFAIFLAFALWWSGISTIEMPQGLAQTSSDPPHVIADAGGTGAAPQGSVADHHLDDLPAQALHDTPPETPSVLPAPPKPRVDPGLAAYAQGRASVLRAPPFDAGPLRPPCRTA